jgi:hypothetical protein
MGEWELILQLAEASFLRKSIAVPLVGLCERGLFDQLDLVVTEHPDMGRQRDKVRVV